LARLGEDARPLAGGHSLIPMMKLRLAQPRTPRDLGRIAGLKGIRQEQGEIVIGAMTTQRKSSLHPSLPRSAPLLIERPRSSPTRRCVPSGTIGGNMSPMAIQAMTCPVYSSASMRAMC
jgi:carbon-monoxide dehydrogenase medium subunit